MEWWQTLLVALATYAVTKTVDQLLAISKENRDFIKYRREKAYSEIEALKDEMGKLYELSANWNAYQAKGEEYAKLFATDYALVGKYNKYPVSRVRLVIRFNGARSLLPMNERATDETILSSTNKSFDNSISPSSRLAIRLSLPTRPRHVG